MIFCSPTQKNIYCTKIENFVSLIERLFPKIKDELQKIQFFKILLNLLTLLLMKKYSTNKIVCKQILQLPSERCAQREFMKFFFSTNSFK